MFESGQAFHFFIAILFGPEWHGNQKSAEETPHNSSLFFKQQKTHKKFSQFNHLRFPKLSPAVWWGVSTKSPPQKIPQKNIMPCAGCCWRMAVWVWSISVWWRRWPTSTRPGLGISGGPNGGFLQGIFSWEDMGRIMVLPWFFLPP